MIGTDRSAGRRAMHSGAVACAGLAALAVLGACSAGVSDSADHSGVSTPRTGAKSSSHALTPPQTGGTPTTPPPITRPAGSSGTGTGSGAPHYYPNAQVIAAVKKVDHPAFAKACPNNWYVAEILQFEETPGATYAAALSECTGGTGSSPADLWVVEPYGTGLQAIYSIESPLTASGGTLIPVSFTMSGNHITIRYADPDGTPVSYYTRYGTLYTGGADMEAAHPSK